MTLDLGLLAERMGKRPYQFHPVIGSTMDAARDWLHDGASHGSLVLADEQTAGRGRLNRNWKTPPDSALALSVILRVAPSTLPQVTMLGALAVAEAFDKLGVPNVGIKWPNDILINGQKACGILVEVDWDGINLRGVILGIGVNVALDFTGTDLEGQATSIQSALTHPVNRLDVLTEIIYSLDTRWALLGSSTLLKAWKSRLVTLGRRVTVHAPHTFTGIAEDVDDDGALWVRDEEGFRRRILAGDVRVRDAQADG
jgi:BirA family biotin operon repressor/biotin-[acetyl-CoA-carboxylase] ligase